MNISMEDGDSLSDLTNRVTVVDIFDSEAQAKSSVQEMEYKGMEVPYISIVAKNYKDPQSALNWDGITAEGGLAKMLPKLGISEQTTSRCIEATDNGKFLVIEVGSDRQASQVQHVVEKAGHSMQEQ